MTKKEIIKSLRICAGQNSTCAGCIYAQNKGNGCSARLRQLAADMLENEPEPEAPLVEEVDPRPALLAEFDYNQGQCLALQQLLGLDLPPLLDAHPDNDNTKLARQVDCLKGYAEGCRFYIGNGGAAK